jgi:hypothetical protein
MAKTKSKSKIDIKQFLIAKGEYVAIGVAGLFLVILLLWGITKWSSAKPPTETVKALKTGADQVQRGINRGKSELTEEDKQPAQVPVWVTTPYVFNPVSTKDFPLTNPQFDPTAKPDTKRENPHVLPIEVYQVDLVRGSMKGTDIIEGNDGVPRIAFLTTKTIAAPDKAKMKLVSDAIRNKAGKLKTQPKGPQPVPMGMGMGGIPMGMGILQPGGGPGPGEGGFGFGYDANAQRVEKAIEYVARDQVDEWVSKGKPLAMTVVPLRMVTIHAEIPYKKQLEEIKRALRLPTLNDAAAWGPYFDGYNIKRKVSRMMPDGKLHVIQDFADYNFEDKYRTLIDARKNGDHFEEGYLAYFIRYEMALALPLPQLITETQKNSPYPEIRLKNILATIEKLKAAAKPQVTPSALLERLKGGTPRGDLYRPQNSQLSGAETLFGPEGTMDGGPRFSQEQMGGFRPGGSGRPAGAIDPKNQFNPNRELVNTVEIEHLLMRFLDVDVEPGKTYEYQIQLRMRNPNYMMDAAVSKPADAKKEFLDSPWVQTTAITIPGESFLYAADWSAYSKKIKEEYEKEKVLMDRLQVKEHQAVVQTCNWMEQIRTGDGGKREPVGAWVVADFPVARGEYIGRKQYVKLPLWSSENTAYILREIPDDVIPPKGGKRSPQPRGWLIDFSNNKSILVDFEGGKVRTKVGSRDVTEEAGTEMLIYRPDGRLTVRRSVEDERDETRLGIVADWASWIKTVEARKASSAIEGDPGFSPRPPGPGGGSPDK